MAAAPAVLAGAALAGGRVGAGLPSAAWFLALACGTGLLGFLVHRQPLHRRRLLATTAPAAGIVVAMYASDELVHFLGATSDLGMLLAVAHVGLLVYVQSPSCSNRFLATGALGGLVGAACASLLGLAIADGIGGFWVPGMGWVGGIVAGGALGSRSAQGGVSVCRKISISTLPLLGAWFMAVIASFPAAPRHELATSAGAQALGGSLAVMLAGASVALLRAERRQPGTSVLGTVRLAASTNVRVVVTLSLLLIGALQAASYSAVTMDDLLHYWSVADNVSWRGTYPFWSNRTDLPVFPMTLLVSFGLLGHTYHAALAPLFVANLFLPLAIFGAARAFEVSRTVAYVVAVLSVVFPLIQVYSLGAVEPDPIFILLLALATLVVGRIVRAPERRGWAVLLGLLAGLAATTRPEGPLYAGLFVLGAIIATRRAATGLAALSAAAVIAPFVVYVYSGLGRPWPTAGQSFSLPQFIENAGVIGSSTWPAASRVVLMNDVRFAILMGLILALFAFGSLALAGRYPGLILIPLAAVINIIGTVGLSASTIRPGELSEFVRHIAYPTPIVAVMVALGVGSASRCFGQGPRSRFSTAALATAAAVYLAAGSLYVLGTPEEYFHGHNSGSLLTNQVYVNAPELWQNPFYLPCLPCPETEWDFTNFRADLFDWYRPFNNRSDSAGTSYQTLTAAVAAFGFVVSLLTEATRTGKNQVPVSGQPCRWRVLASPRRSRHSPLGRSEKCEDCSAKHKDHEASGGGER